MKGDFSRSTFRQKKHYRKVNMQQGRVQLDSDWNEQIDIHTHYERAALQDIIGSSGTLNNSDGFSITGNMDPLFDWNNWNKKWITILKKFIKQNFGVDWIETSDFIKSDKTISISDGSHSLFIKLDDIQNLEREGVVTIAQATRATLTIDNKSVYEFIVKKDGDKLNIHQKWHSIGEGHYYVDGILCENEVEIDASRQPDLPWDKYLFNWDKVTGKENEPGSESNMLKEFLKQNFKIETVQLEKIDERRISIIDGKHSLSIVLDDVQTKATKATLINGGEKNTIYEFIPRIENGKLNIYYKLNLAVPTEPGTYLSYLDVWERHLTVRDDPEILEPALGGADTTTRTKIAWQVKLLKIGNESESQKYTCLSSIPSWDELVKKSTGTLQARSKPQIGDDNPCILPPGAGYRGLENQLYRIEIHNPGEAGKGATFKWSRENGMVIADIKDISYTKLTIDDRGRDSLPGFATSPLPWVEVIDDRHELWGLPGTMCRLKQITEINENTFILDVDSAEGDPLNNYNFPQEFHPKIRRWDSSGCINAEIPDDNEGYIQLECGIEVKFAQGTYKINDYWLIPARAAEKDVKWPKIGNTPEALPPEGEHHFCRLAILKYENDLIERIRDCRRFFPSTTALNGLYANTGIITLTVREGQGRLFGPINHSLKDLSVPPAIILGSADDPSNIKFDDNSKKYIAEQVNKDNFWVRAPSPDGEIKKKLRWWAIPALDKGVQNFEPIPNIRIDPGTIKVGQSATIIVVDPEANTDGLIRDKIKVTIEVDSSSPEIDVMETEANSGVFEVQMTRKIGSIEVVGNQTIVTTESDRKGGSLSAKYEPVSAAAELPYRPVLTIITVTPSTANLDVGGTQTFKAEPKDQFRNPIAATITWKSNDTSVGTVDSSGNFKALAAGTTKIEATSETVSGTVSGNATVKVQAPAKTLTSIAVTPANPTITQGQNRQFVATGTYSDGTTAVITDSVTWKSYDTSVGTFDSSGNFKALAAGITTIEAKSETVIGTATVTVTPEVPMKGTIKGTVYDVSGVATIMGATVTVKKGPWKSATKSKQEGVYTITEVPIGKDYTVEGTKGELSDRINFIEVVADRPTIVDLSLDKPHA